MDELGERAEARLREMSELVRDQVRYDVKRVMQRVGVPTREDFAGLATRLETLSSKIDEIAQRDTAPNAANAANAANTADLQTQPRATARKKKG